MARIRYEYAPFYVSYPSQTRHRGTGGAGVVFCRWEQHLKRYGRVVGVSVWVRVAHRVATIRTIGSRVDICASPEKYCRRRLETHNGAYSRQSETLHRGRGAARVIVWSMVTTSKAVWARRGRGGMGARRAFLFLRTIGSRVDVCASP